MWLTLRQNQPFNKVSLPLLHKAISKAFITPEREYETVLECAYSKILESRFFVSGTCILDSNRLRDSGLLVLYSGFHQHKFPRFWNLDSLKKDDNLVDTVNFFTPTVMECQFSMLFLTVLFIIPRYLIVTWCFLFPMGGGGGG